VVEVKIAGIQKRREELDEEMCDLLNQKLTEHDRSFLGFSGLFRNRRQRTAIKITNRNEEQQNHSADIIKKVRFFKQLLKYNCQGHQRTFPRNAATERWIDWILTRIHTKTAFDIISFPFIGKPISLSA
jgi:hypothetical protein